MNKKKSLLFLLIAVLTVSCQKNDKDIFLLGSGIGINNATLMVQNIDSTVNQYKEKLGFTVGRIAPNGEFSGTVSSSIGFADMTSFVLLSISDSADQNEVPNFISSFLEKQDGVQQYALSTSSADSTFMWLSSQGYEIDSINIFRSTEVSEGWSRDDGAFNRKSIDFNTDLQTGYLPRFIERSNFDYATVNEQWRTYYGYQRMFRSHANGVVGISALKIAVNDIDSAVENFQEMGFKIKESDYDFASFELFKNQELQLVSGSSNQSVNDFLIDRGEGVFAIRFEVDDLDSTIAFFKNNLTEDAFIQEEELFRIQSTYAFGVQLEFVEESEEQNEMAEMLSLRGKLEPKAAEYASKMYLQYCALCHGDNREGYANDHAPSLKSKSLLATSMNNNFMRYTIQFGRANTAMAGYQDTHGGPMERIDIEILLKWLYEEAGVEEAINLSREPVYGDIPLGAEIYSESCASCHGDKGEGITAPALGNPMLLATATDHFLRYAIAEGRDGTPMMAFKDSLSDDEIDAVTAFLRSRASGWDVPEPSKITVPTPDQYVLNPDGEDPVFDLREDKFVSAVQVDKAMKEGKKMIIMDARSEVAWRQTHIPGSFPVPYYDEPETFIHDIPNDGTQIVVYCACPHAASLRVMGTLKRYGFENVSIIDKGILVWAQMGLPVRNGQ